MQVSLLQFFFFAAQTAAVDVTGTGDGTVAHVLSAGVGSVDVSVSTHDDSHNTIEGSAGGFLVPSAFLLPDEPRPRPQPRPAPIPSPPAIRAAGGGTVAPLISSGVAHVDRAPIAEDDEELLLLLDAA
jgi:hypothetical protein